MKQPFHEGTRHAADRIGGRINWVVERLCAALVAGMVLIVWIGIVSRYLVDLGVTWNEELARYMMIWAALLAVSAGIYRREHIGIELFFHLMPRRVAVTLRLILDLLGLAFFLFLLIYGLGMTADGMDQYATIFNMTMVVPFASVPAAAALAVVQLTLTAIRDTGSDRDVAAPVGTGVS